MATTERPDGPFDVQGLRVAVPEGFEDLTHYLYESPDSSHRLIVSPAGEQLTPENLAEQAEAYYQAAARAMGARLLDQRWQRFEGGKEAVTMRLEYPPNGSPPPAGDGPDLAGPPPPDDGPILVEGSGDEPDDFIEPPSEPDGSAPVFAEAVALVAFPEGRGAQLSLVCPRGEIESGAAQLDRMVASLREQAGDSRGAADPGGRPPGSPWADSPERKAGPVFVDVPEPLRAASTYQFAYRPEAGVGPIRVELHHAETAPDGTLVVGTLGRAAGDRVSLLRDADSLRKDFELDSRGAGAVPPLRREQIDALVKEVLASLEPLGGPTPTAPVDWKSVNVGGTPLFLSAQAEPVSALDDAARVQRAMNEALDRLSASIQRSH